MDTLKKLFPYSFKEKNGLGALIVNIIVYLVIGIVAGALIGLLSGIPIVGWIISIVGGLVDLYVFAGIVVSILDYCKVLK